MKRYNSYKLSSHAAVYMSGQNHELKMVKITHALHFGVSIDTFDPDYPITVRIFFPYEI